MGCVSWMKGRKYGMSLISWLGRRISGNEWFLLQRDIMTNWEKKKLYNLTEKRSQWQWEKQREFKLRRPTYFIMLHTLSFFFFIVTFQTTCCIELTLVYLISLPWRFLPSHPCRTIGFFWKAGLLRDLSFSANWVTNSPSWFTIPRRLHNSLTLLCSCISLITVFLHGLAMIPSVVIMLPRNLISLFWRFKLVHVMCDPSLLQLP